MENSELKVAHVKPLVFIKIQTTGLNFNTDRIIELSLTKIETDGKTKNGTRFINPEMEIPADSISKNGITNEMVKGCPTFREIAPGIHSFIEGCDFAGFNISFFDLKFLSQEFNRAELEFTILGRKIVDLADIFHTMEPRDLSAAVSFYCDKKFKKDSTSKEVTDMYINLLNGMMDKYKGVEVEKAGKKQIIEPTVESINNIFNKHGKRLDLGGFIVMNEQNRPIFAEGKHKGKIISDSALKDKDVEEYCDWIINASNFAPDTNLIVRKIIEKAKSVAIAK